MSPPGLRIGGAKEQRGVLSPLRASPLVPESLDLETGLPKELIFEINEGRGSKNSIIPHYLILNDDKTHQMGTPELELLVRHDSSWKADSKAFKIEIILHPFFLSGCSIKIFTHSFNVWGWRILQVEANWLFGCGLNVDLTLTFLTLMIIAVRAAFDLLNSPQLEWFLMDSPPRHRKSERTLEPLLLSYNVARRLLMRHSATSAYITGMRFPYTSR